jgi:putative FmdB family regulatory protein
MPLYEYLCHSCGRKFEVIEKFSDQPLKMHEGCGGEVERLISAPAFHFKGSGWYVTDYAKGNSGAPKSDGGKSDQAAKSGESKTESGSEAKTGESKTAESKPASESKTTASKPAPAVTTTESK